jgi:hypothetical protein
MSAFVMLALPATPAVAFAGYMIGHMVGFDPFGWALAAHAVVGVPRWAHGWQRERKLAADTEKAARTADGT